MRNLSYQEKSLYAALVAILAVFVPYLVLIHIHRLSVGFIATAVTLLIAAQIVLQAIVALATRNRLKDERDRLIRLRGYRAGYITVLLLMLLGMAALWAHSLAGETGLGQIGPSHMALHFLSVFYGILMIGELARTLAQLIAYRRAL